METIDLLISEIHKYGRLFDVKTYPSQNGSYSLLTEIIKDNVIDVPLLQNTELFCISYLQQILIQEQNKLSYIFICIK